MNENGLKDQNIRSLIEETKEFRNKLVVLDDKWDFHGNSATQLKTHLERFETRVTGHSACLFFSASDYTFILWFPKDHADSKKMIYFSPPGKVKITKNIQTVVDLVLKASKYTPYSIHTLAKYVDVCVANAGSSLSMIQDFILCQEDPRVEEEEEEEINPRLSLSSKFRLKKGNQEAQECVKRPEPTFKVNTIQQEPSRKISPLQLNGMMETHSIFGFYAGSVSKLPPRSVNKIFQQIKRDSEARRHEIEQEKAEVNLEPEDANSEPEEGEETLQLEPASESVLPQEVIKVKTQVEDTIVLPIEKALSNVEEPVIIQDVKPALEAVEISKRSAIVDEKPQVPEAAHETSAEVTEDVKPDSILPQDVLEAVEIPEVNRSAVVDEEEIISSQVNGTISEATHDDPAESTISSQDEEEIVSSQENATSHDDPAVSLQDEEEVTEDVNPVSILPQDALEAVEIPVFEVKRSVVVDNKSQVISDATHEGTAESTSSSLSPRDDEEEIVALHDDATTSEATHEDPSDPDENEIVSAESTVSPQDEEEIVSAHEDPAESTSGPEDEEVVAISVGDENEIPPPQENATISKAVHEDPAPQAEIISPPQDGALEAVEMPVATISEAAHKDPAKSTVSPLDEDVIVLPPQDGAVENERVAQQKNATIYEAVHEDPAESTVFPQDETISPPQDGALEAVEMPMATISEAAHKDPAESTVSPLDENEIVLPPQDGAVENEIVSPQDNATIYKAVHEDPSESTCDPKDEIVSPPQDDTTQKTIPFRETENIEIESGDDLFQPQVSESVLNEMDQYRRNYLHRLQVLEARTSEKRRAMNDQIFRHLLITTESPKEENEITPIISGKIPIRQKKQPDPFYQVIEVTLDEVQSAPGDSRKKERLEALRSKRLKEMESRSKKRLERSKTTTASIEVKGGNQKASNSKLIRNAIEYNLLAGQHLVETKQAALDVLDATGSDNYVVLFRSDKSLRFYGLYVFDVSTESVNKVFGKGPNHLTDDMVSQFYRYNSGRKEFAPVATRSFTVRTDAVALDKRYLPRLKKPSALF